MIKMDPIQALIAKAKGTKEGGFDYFPGHDFREGWPSPGEVINFPYCAIFENESFVRPFSALPKNPVEGKTYAAGVNHVQLVGHHFFNTFQEMKAARKGWKAMFKGDQELDSGGKVNSIDLLFDEALGAYATFFLRSIGMTTTDKLIHEGQQRLVIDIGGEWEEYITLKRPDMTDIQLSAEVSENPGFGPIARRSQNGGV